MVRFLYSEKQELQIKTLRIIHLDDDVFSASLVQTFLAEEGLVCDIKRVETREDFIVLLEQGGFDLVLADLNLPAMSGMTALVISRERCPGLPFIFVTDTMGEEVAIESLKSGATDYVLKYRLSRLGSAVRSALREAEESEKRRKEEEALRESEQLFRNAFENAVNGRCLTKPDRRFIKVNNSFSEMLGYSAEELATMTFMDLTHPDDLAASRRLAEELLSGRTFAGHLEKRYLHRDGRNVWALTSVFLQRDEKGFPLYFITQIQNITEQKKLEDQLHHAQKLESIGQLAGGMGHDFNNILTTIIGHASILKKKLPDDGALAHHVQQILIASDSASRLTGSLLAFSRKQPIELRELNLNDAVTRVEMMISGLLRNVECIINLADEVLTVMGDEGQLEQVLMNLVTNAWDAMPHGGVLNISTGIAVIDRKFVEVQSFGKPGKYALLTVTDNGIGMDEETRKKIFEPFFTTKESGVGTGLGLSMAYGIVKNHKGFINCDSESGRWTSFRIYLPLTGGTNQ
ncbi:MAG: PAS domain S-box protein [Desulfuromonadales bacterium]|nr:PAS domain S-box protein [Desulfuromonadales bacterium]